MAGSLCARHCTNTEQTLYLAFLLSGTALIKVQEGVSCDQGGSISLTEAEVRLGSHFQAQQPFNCPNWAGALSEDKETQPCRNTLALVPKNTDPENNFLPSLLSLREKQCTRQKPKFASSPSQQKYEFFFFIN